MASSPQLKLVKLDGRQVQHEAVRQPIESAIKLRNQVAVRDIIVGTGGSPEQVKRCTIEYHTGDGVSKRRSLAPGQSFDFGNDIYEISYTGQVKDIATWEKIFAYMDTTDKFLVHNGLFKQEELKREDRNVLTIIYVLPDGIERDHFTDQGQDFVFDRPGGGGKQKFPPREKTPQPPNPSPPGPCRCPCPVCAEQHQTKEQRREQEERRRREEQERREELEELRRSVRGAVATAEEAQHGVRGARADIENIYRELADIRRELSEKDCGGGHGHDVPPLFKVCIVGSQILALVVLASYTYRSIILGKKL